MPILRGTSKLDSPKAKDVENKRETRSMKSPTVCASSRLKEFKTSTKLTKAQLKTAASARLAERNKRKAEKDTEISKEKQVVEIKTEEKSQQSSKRGSPTCTKASKTPIVEGLRSKKLANETEDEKLHGEQSRRKKGQEKSGHYTTSDDSQDEEKGGGRRKRKQSLEEKDDPIRRKRKHTFFEYVVEAVPEAKNVEQAEEAGDVIQGGRRRSKRGSIPNTQYLKNFIDPSRKKPKGEFLLFHSHQN